MKFEKIYCINLKRRPDRLSEFLEGVPPDFENTFGKIELFPAYDGRLMKAPPYWRGGNGSWGCYNSHKRAIEEALIKGVESLLLFEDDALFLPDFCQQAQVFLNALPKDAEVVYLGGQHLKRKEEVPQKVNRYVYRPYNVNRTHAWGIIGQRALLTVLDHLNRRNWTTPHHIDHWLGALTESRKLNVYCPARWLVDQRAGHSDVAGRDKGFTHWRDAAETVDISAAPFIAILGLHSSGSSALSGALYHLGLHLGNRLVGYYGQPPIRGGEAEGLLKLFEWALPVPAVEWTVPEEQVRRRLLNWIDDRRAEAVRRGVVAAGKYPQLAATAGFLPEALGSNLKVINITRPFEESVRSLQRRFKKLTAAEVERHQRRLQSGIDLFREKVSRENFFTVEFSALVENPKKVLAELAAVCPGLDAAPDRLDAAAAYIDPAKKHI